jgi:ABC-type lipoprotein release transport system permease subunit
MNDFKMAWRNLWRNKRRTLITAASVFFAVFFALLMRSLQLGSYDRMFRNVIESYSGYLQVQQKDYFDEPVLDNSFQADQEIFGMIESDPNVKAIVPRLESFALAAAGSRTQGVMVMGIDPEGEDEVSGIRNRLVRFKLTEEAIRNLKNESLSDRTRKLTDVFKNESYTGPGRLMLDLGISENDSSSVFPLLRKYASVTNNFLNPEDSGSVVIGNGLSEYLKINIGDTLVLIGQGYHGVSAAGKYTIKGIVKLPSPDFDNLVVYLPVDAARKLFGADGISTSAVIMLNNTDEKNLQLTAERLQKIIKDPLTIRTWRELNALMVNQMDADNKSGMIMIGILYLVIAFGVFGTVLMMLAERRREFGMLVSIGMQKRKLAKVIAFEMLLIGFLGVVTGIISSLPVVIYGNIYPLRFRGEMARMWEDYGFEPVMPTLLPDSYYFWQTVVVLIILAIAIGFSIRKIFRINVISSLKA